MRDFIGYGINIQNYVKLVILESADLYFIGPCSEIIPPESLIMLSRVVFLSIS
jgi:hypothetical protein